MSVDYSQCKKAEQQLALLEETVNKLQMANSCLLLVNYEGVSIGLEYMNRVKPYGNTIFKEKVELIAVLGISGLKKILYDGYNRATGANNTKSFSTREEAIDWLIGAN